MKKVLWIIVILFSLSAFSSLKAYDTTLAKYIPLQIGNMWVYYGVDGQQAPPYQSYWFAKYRITGTLDTLGKRYYLIHDSIVIISGGVSCSVLPRLIRIDSTTMNIKDFVIGCSPGEQLVDSLRSKKNDTALVCIYAYNKDVCTDTSNINLFGNIFPIKYFSHSQFEGGDSRKYAKSIGIIYESYSCHGCSCYENLVGCRINNISYGDTSMLVGLQNISSEAPKSFSLSQNYPNPFNPDTKIKFAVASVGQRHAFDVQLKIYDAIGREVATLINQPLQPGTYEAEWDASNFPSGVYFYKLTVSSEQLTKYSETKKLVLIK